MDITVSQNHFAKALANAARIASTKSSLPALANILLRTDGSQFVIQATNLEVAVTQRISAKIKTPGEVTLPARLLHEYVQNLPEKTITLKQAGQQVELSAGSYSSKFNTTTEDDFPELPQLDDTVQAFSLPAKDFKQAASQVVMAASTDTTRPVLTGIYWHVVDDELVFAATDGYRLAEKVVTKTSSAISAIVPTSTVQEIIRLLTDDVDELMFRYNESQIDIMLNDTILTSRLIDGAFPDYRQLIPSSTTTTAEVETEEFSRITKIANLFARESGSGVVLSVDIDDNSISMHAIASEKGENTSKMAAKISGEPGTVSLNARYITDALQAFEDATITIGFSGKLAAVVLKNAKSQGYTHIIMPLKS